MTMDNLYYAKRRLKSVNKKDYDSKESQGTFEERYKRVTLYLEKPLYEVVNDLREEGEIPNMTRFVNKAIKYYLKEKQLNQKESNF